MIPLAASNWDEAEKSAIRRVIASGRYTMGPEVKRFERQFAQHVMATHAVMVNSGSSANLLMIAALFFTGRIKRGATEAVPAVSWSTTYAPLIQFGMKIRLIDVDDSLNIDPKQIKDCDLLFAVNLLGNPCDFDRFPYGLAFIVDNCESMGGYYNGRECGTFGLLESYSFFFSHHLTTMAKYYEQRASAGFIITEGSQISKRAVGYINTPGIYSTTQVEGWKKVTQAVHDKEGKMFLQLACRQNVPDGFS